MNRWKIISILLVLILMMYCLSFLNQKEVIRSLQKEYYESVCQADSLMIYKLNFELNYLSIGMSAKDVICWTKEQQLLLSEIVGNNSVLVYRYSDINCNTCVDAEIEVLQNIYEDNFESVLILCSYSIDKDFYIFKKVNRIKFPIFRIEHNSFDWIPEKDRNAYCFILHPDLKISNMYIPDKSFPKVNEMYLNAVKQLVCNFQ